MVSRSCAGPVATLAAIELALFDLSLFSVSGKPIEFSLINRVVSSQMSVLIDTVLLA